MAGGDGSQAIVAAIAAEHELPYACIPAGPATTSRSTSASIATTSSARSTRSSTAASDASTSPRSTAACSSTTSRSASTPTPSSARAIARPSSHDPRHAARGPRTRGRRAGSAVDRARRQRAFRRRRDPGLQQPLPARQGRRLRHPPAHRRRPARHHRRRRPRGRGERRRRLQRPWREWTAPQFEVRADGPIAAGIDGEALMLDAPLRFAIRPASCACGSPARTPEPHPPRRSRTASPTTAREVLKIAFGRHTRLSHRPVRRRGIRARSASASRLRWACSSGSACSDSSAPANSASTRSGTSSASRPAQRTAARLEALVVLGLDHQQDPQRVPQRDPAELGGGGVDDGQVAGLDGAQQARVGRSVARHMRTYVRMTGGRTEAATTSFPSLERATCSTACRASTRPSASWSAPRTAGRDCRSRRRSTTSTGCGRPSSLPPRIGSPPRSRPRASAPDPSWRARSGCPGPTGCWAGSSRSPRPCAPSPRARTRCDGSRVHERPDGQTVVEVYPHDLKERLLLHGFSAEVWMEPGVSAAGPARHGRDASTAAADPDGQLGARARRGQHRVDRAARHALQAVRRGRGRRSSR